MAGVSAKDPGLVAFGFVAHRGPDERQCGPPVVATQHRLPGLQVRQLIAVNSAKTSGLGALHQANDEQQDHGTDGGVDNGRENSASDHDAKGSEHPGADEGADDADDNIADEAKTDPFDDDTGEPAGNRAYNDEDDQCFQSHDVSPDMRHAPDGGRSHQVNTKTRPASRVIFM